MGLVLLQLAAPRAGVQVCRGLSPPPPQPQQPRPAWPGSHLRACGRVWEGRGAGGLVLEGRPHSTAPARDHRTTGQLQGPCWAGSFSEVPGGQGRGSRAQAQLPGRGRPGLLCPPPETEGHTGHTGVLYYSLSEETKRDTCVPSRGESCTLITGLGRGRRRWPRRGALLGWAVSREGGKGAGASPQASGSASGGIGGKLSQ